MSNEKSFVFNFVPRKKKVEWRPAVRKETQPKVDDVSLSRSFFVLVKSRDYGVSGGEWGSITSRNTKYVILSFREVGGLLYLLFGVSRLTGRPTLYRVNSA